MYTRALVTYNVEAGERVSAWLLMPQGAAPTNGWPAVLAIHQHDNHYDLGKAEPLDWLATRCTHTGKRYASEVMSCCVLTCCALKTGDRHVRFVKPTVMDDAGYERFEFTKRLLAGSCLQTKYLHDLTCAVDVLASLPGVNRERLGVIGHSLGGLEALWLAWYDARITAAVSSCGFGLLRTLVRDGINHGFATYVPGILEVCDLDALVGALAPRAFLLTAGETDPLFPIDGVRSTGGECTAPLYAGRRA